MNFQDLEAAARKPIDNYLLPFDYDEANEDVTDWNSAANTHNRDMLMMEDSPSGDEATFSKVCKDEGSDQLFGGPSKY